MVEWLLVFTLNLQVNATVPPATSAGTVAGFQSKAACDAAALQIAESYIRQIRQARGDRKTVPGNQINHECLQIKK